MFHVHLFLRGMAVQAGLFRQEAIEQHLRAQQKTVLPKFIAPPVFLFLWGFFSLFLIAGITVWTQHIPVLVSASGMVVAQEHDTLVPVAVVLFVPQDVAMHTGDTATLHLGTSGLQTSSHVSTVGEHAASPTDIAKQYQVRVAEPSRVVILPLESHLSLYAGSLATAQVTIGEKRLLSYFPGLEGVA